METSVNKVNVYERYYKKYYYAHPEVQEKDRYQKKERYSNDEAYRERKKEIAREYSRKRYALMKALAKESGMRVSALVKA